MTTTLEYGQKIESATEDLIRAAGRLVKAKRALKALADELIAERDKDKDDGISIRDRMDALIDSVERGESKPSNWTVGDNQLLGDIRSALNVIDGMVHFADVALNLTRPYSTMHGEGEATCRTCGDETESYASTVEGCHGMEAVSVDTITRECANCGTTHEEYKGSGEAVAR